MIRYFSFGCQVRVQIRFFWSILLSFGLKQTSIQYPLFSALTLVTDCTVLCRVVCFLLIQKEPTLILFIEFPNG
jgi:hypothetical protein